MHELIQKGVRGAMSQASELRFWRRVAMCVHRTSNFREHYRDCAVCCWPWEGATTEGGYGKTRYTFMDRDEVYAHQVAWRFAHGGEAFPPGTEATQACDTRSCCNPSHISACPHRENMAEMGIRRKADRRGGSRPRKLTWEKVGKIRVLGEAGVLTQGQIGTQFGVSAQMISDILCGRAWGRASAHGRRRGGERG